MLNMCHFSTCVECHVLFHLFSVQSPKFGSGSGFIAEIQVTEILTKLVLMTCGHILPCPSVAQKSIIFFGQVGGNHAETVIKGEELFDCQFFKTDDEKVSLIY